MPMRPLPSLLVLVLLCGCGDGGVGLDGGAVADLAASADLVPPRRALSFAMPRVFPAGMPLAHPGYPTIQPLVAGDFDGDQALDLAVPSTEAVHVTALLGDGKGGFGAPMGMPVKGRPTALVAADFDGDGLDELVAGYDGNKVTLIHGRANRIFDESVDTDWPDGTYVLAAADFSGDGKPDIAAAPLDGKLLTFGLWDGMGGFTASTAWPLTSPVVLLSTGDLDGNGLADVAVSETFQFLDLLTSTGGALMLWRQVDVPGATLDATVIADLDRDGRTDVVITPSAVGAQVLRGVAGNKLEMGQTLMMPGHATAARAADLDLDGNLDVVMSRDRANEVVVLLGDGQGNLSPATRLPVDGVAMGLVVRDLDGDGRADIAVAQGAGGVRVLLNTSR